MTRQYLGIGLVLLGLAGALLYEAKHTGLTVDEPSHFAAGYAYWLGEDVLLPSDTPPFTRLISGWVARISGAPDPRQSKHWATRDAYLIGTEILGSPGGRRLRLFSRLPFLLFPLGIVFLVWYWARQLYSPQTAILLAVSAALEPTILGHGVLIKSDVASAFGALWFAYGAWRYWCNPVPRTLLLMIIALVLAILTKFTLIPLIFIAFALGLWRGPRLLAAVLIPVAIYCGVLASGQFQGQPVSPEKVEAIAGNNFPRQLLPAVKMAARLPWPNQFIDGIGYISGSLHGAGFEGYMLGKKINGWTPAYFPFAWLLKFPIPLQLLTLAGLAGFLMRLFTRQANSAEVFIWGLALLLFGLALCSNFHIGFRHILPVLPLLILGGGFTLERFKAWRLSFAAALIWLTISSIWIYPQGISYFNEWAGGPKNGWKYLADSNVDWGQNYPEMAAHLDRKGVRDARAFLFSFDNPWHYMDDGTLSPQPWPAPGTLPGQHYRPVQGTYVISVNLLSGLLMPAGHEDYLAEFRQLTPVASAGYSILIYKID